MRAFVALLLTAALAGGCQPRYVYNDPDDRMYGPTPAELEDLHQWRAEMLGEGVLDVLTLLLLSLFQMSFDAPDNLWKGHHHHEEVSAPVHHMHRDSGGGS